MLIPADDSRRTRRPVVTDATCATRFGFLDAVKKGQLTFVVFHILGSSIASLNEIEDTSTFVGDSKYFLVKNFINNTSFFEWDQATHSSYFEKFKDAVEITIPKLNEMAYEQVELAWTLSDIRRQQGPQGRSSQLFVCVAWLCPALARQRLGRV